MRYFLHLAYNGAAYAGWQIQPHAPSVQETIQRALSTILNTPIEITGCGRTDAGVHADHYYAHFDFAGTFPRAFQRRLNKFLPEDIVVYDLLALADEAHARFDATYRAYRYHLALEKDPFRIQTSTLFPFAEQTDPEKVQAAAALLLDYREFTPFCKTGSDAKTMRCELFRSEWTFGPREWVYHIAADRFLRGMVRLCVGMCLNVGMGKLELADVQHALDTQTLLPKSWSAGPEGLFLTDIRYPYIGETEKN